MATDAGAPVNDSARRMYYFALLAPDEKQAAILRMAKSGMTLATIAAATRLSIEMLREIIADATAASGTAS